MTVAILTEKPSAARNFAKALGGPSGTYNGEAYVIVAALGHLFEFVDPSDMVDPALKGSYSKWNLPDLPWDHSQMDFKRALTKGSAKTLATIKQACASASEIVIATDVDPTGEGQAIAWNILDEIGMHHKRITRMDFTDEAPASLQKSFTARQALPPMEQDPEYMKADYRARFDLLSMQFTRVATLQSGQREVLRQGRLKSAIVLLVGDQQKAHDDYTKTVSYQARYRDENDVLYTDPAQPLFAAEAEVPGGRAASAVTLDKRSDKRTAPRRLLDLSALSARLSTKGHKASTVLQTYQKMYEDQIVSYPRTDDKTITKAQFAELLPLVDRIAGVVGVDTALLTHRKPRATHVKDTGAHGANRPGLRVPPSLDALKAKYGPLSAAIYEELARSFLAIVAEDYLYESQEGHVTDAPTYLGRAAVPKSMGWKLVFSDTDAVEDDENAAGLGKRAEPIIHEIVPPRPEKPSMTWLMKQLERRNVGTGATRTSTYAEVTNASAKFTLLSESRGRITMTEIGQMSYRMLPGTRIGDLSLTEQVYASMDAIAAGTTTAEAELAKVAPWIKEDIDTMGRNALTMRKELGVSEEKIVQKEKFQGTWARTGEAVSFNRVWSGHTFTDKECTELLAGKEIEFSATSAKTGNDFNARGTLEKQNFNGHDYVGFKVDFGPKKDASGKPVPPSEFLGVQISAADQAKLGAGERVFLQGMMGRKKKAFDATVSFGPNPERGGEVGMIMHFEPRK